MRGTLQLLHEKHSLAHPSRPNFSSLLSSQAETSDVGAQPNPYRVLFAFHAARHNWRHAAAAMHRFAQRVAQEAPVTAASVRVQAESVLAAVTALRLLPPDSAWLPAEEGYPGPSKRPRIEGEAGRALLQLQSSIHMILL